MFTLYYSSPIAAAFLRTSTALVPPSIHIRPHFAVSRTVNYRPIGSKYFTPPRTRPTALGPTRTHLAIDQPPHQIHHSLHLRLRGKGHECEHPRCRRGPVVDTQPGGRDARWPFEWRVTQERSEVGSAAKTCSNQRTSTVISLFSSGAYYFSLTD